MKIDEMIQRETFYNIFKETISYYVNDILNCNAEIDIRKTQSGKSFYIYPRLNTVITNNPINEIKEYLHNEYAISGNLIKHFTVQLYMKLLLNGNGKYSSKGLFINPIIDDADSILIYPGNRKIRIINFSKSYIDVVLKHGFSSNMLKNEVTFREKFEDEKFILPIKDKKDRFFREKILKGRSLARINDVEDFNMYCKKVIKIKNKFENQFLESINSKEYIEKLKIKLNDYNGKDKAMLKLWYEKITKSLNNFMIPVSISHGDFQKGNVWIDENHNIIILDWETWDKRSIWYDKMIFYHRFRNSKFYIQSLKNVISEHSNITEKVINIVDILKIFIVEDLIWNIEEENSLPNDVSSFGLNFYKNEKNLKDVLSFLI